MKIILLLLFFISGNVIAGPGHDDHEKKKATVKKTHEHDHEDEHSDEEEADDDHGHDHGKKKKKKGAEDEHEHDEEDEHGEKDGHASHSEEGGGGHGGHGDEGSSKAVGEGKAITEVDEKKGFSMSEQALEFIGVEFKNMTSSVLKIPSNALVVNQDEVGFYRLRKGFFKFIPVKDIRRDADSVELDYSAWKFGDRVAISNVDIIRVSDVYSKDNSNYGHAHQDRV